MPDKDGDEGCQGRPQGPSVQTKMVDACGAEGRRVDSHFMHYVCMCVVGGVGICVFGAVMLGRLLDVWLDFLGVWGYIWRGPGVNA